MEIAFRCSACGGPLAAPLQPQGSAINCPACNAPQVVPMTAQPVVLAPAAACTRQTYILVGVLTGVLLGGSFGIHNFIAGRTTTAIVQAILCAIGIVLLLCTFGISYLLNIAVMIWAIVDVCTVTTDGQGRRMA